MDVLAPLIAAVLSGVTYDWQPIDDPQGGVEYVVQVEPELLEAARSGQLKAIESHIPEGVGPIRRIRVVLGGDQSATALTSSPRKEHEVAKPVADDAAPPTAVRHTVRQQGGYYGQPVTDAAGQVEQGFQQAADGFQSSVQQAGQTLQNGYAQPLNTQPYTVQPLQPADEPRKSIGSEFIKGANKLRDGTRDALRNTGEAIEGTAKNFGDGLRTVLTGGESPPPAPAGSGEYVPYSYGAPAAQPGTAATTPAPAFSAQPPVPAGTNPVLTGASPTAATPSSTNWGSSATDWGKPVNQAPAAQPASPPAPTNGFGAPPQDNWVRNGIPTSATPVGGTAPVDPRLASPTLSTTSAAQPNAGSLNPAPAADSAWGDWQNTAAAGSTPPAQRPLAESPYVPMVDPSRQPATARPGDNAMVPVRTVAENQNPPPADFGGGWGSGTAAGPQFPSMPSSQQPPQQPGGTPSQAGFAGWSTNPNNAGQAPGAGLPSIDPGTLPPLDQPLMAPIGGPNQQANGLTPPAAPVSGVPVWEWVATSLVCLGSLGGNLFLGWSYLDARNKYQSALRRSTRGFSRGAAA